MQDTTVRRGRTLGEVVGSLPAATAAALCGIVLLAIGSIGPWATVFAISLDGTRGDGKITLALAAVIALLLATRHTVAIALAFLAAVAATVTVGYDLVHIERVTNGTKVFGIHAASAGWGVYMAVIGAVIALIATAAEYVNARTGG